MSEKNQSTDSTQVDNFKQALKALKLKATDVFAHKEYPDRIVIVTRAGKKHTWNKE